MSVTLSATYSFFQHPIKWLKEWRIRRLVRKHIQRRYAEMQPELQKAEMDMFLYGGAVMKGDKHVPFMDYVKSNQ
jgi:hypothetical protein